MKKFFSVFFIVFSFCLTIPLYGCKGSGGDVKLLSINEASATSSVSYTKDESAVSFVSSNNAQNISDEQTNSQYMIIGETDYYFTLKITLENPNNYYILDFSLESSDSNFKVMINDKYTLLTELPSLRWNSDTNYFCELECYSSEPNYKTTVEMKSLYYSDRTDGSNKYDGDITENNLLNIYKKNDGVVLVQQSMLKYKINVIHNCVDNDSIYFNNQKFNNGDIIDINFGENIVTFNYKFDDISIESNTKTTLTKNSIAGRGISYNAKTGVETCYYIIGCDYDKVELYENGIYKQDAVNKNWAWNNSYDAYLYNGYQGKETDYILIYEDTMILKISNLHSINADFNIEIIQR